MFNTYFGAGGSMPAGMSFPLIVKAASEGAGIGLDDRSVVRSRQELADAAARRR